MKVKRYNDINEKKINFFKSKVEVEFNYNVKFSSHSSDRGKGEGRQDIEFYDMREITKEEIMDLLDKFSKEISKSIADGSIIDSKEFVITDKKWGTSIAVKPFMYSFTSWDLIIKTVFRDSNNSKLKLFRGEFVIESDYNGSISKYINE
jgi:hypothetical protein